MVFILSHQRDREDQNIIARLGDFTHRSRFQYDIYLEAVPTVKFYLIVSSKANIDFVIFLCVQFGTQQQTLPIIC